MKVPVYLSAVTLFYINPAWEQMCGNCWPETGDQSIYFSHVCPETTYKLRPQLSCSSSQVWPARISGVIESVFRCSGPNSKSIVTLTRPMQRKNAPPLTPHPPLLRFLPPFLGIAATGDFHIDHCATKKSVQGARSSRQMQFHSMPNVQSPGILRNVSAEDKGHVGILCTSFVRNWVQTKPP